MPLDLLEALERLLAEASHPGRGPLNQLGVILRPPGSFGRPQCVGLPSQLDLALGQLDQKCRTLPVAADLERAKVLVPVPLRDFRPRSNPQAKPIQIGDADRPVPHSIDQVLTDARRQIAPIVDLRHQLPKTMRPISSPRRVTSSGSVARRKRSARSKNSCCFRFSASTPLSMSSTSIRLVLTLRFFARVRAWAATLAGKLTLCRTVLFAVRMAPLCTNPVQTRGFVSGHGLSRAGPIRRN